MPVVALPDVLKQLVDRKWLGSKTKQGFYRKEGSDEQGDRRERCEYRLIVADRFGNFGAQIAPHRDEFRVTALSPARSDQHIEIGKLVGRRNIRRTRR